MVFFIITGCQQGAKFYLNLPYLIIMAKFMENQVKKSISKVIDMDKLKEVNGGYKNKLI